MALVDGVALGQTVVISLRNRLRELISGDVADARLDALVAVSCEQVTRYAPDAPDAVRDESILRLGAWLWAREPRAVQEVSIGDIRINFRERNLTPNALVNSGARALLSPWRARRALPVEDLD